MLKLHVQFLVMGVGLWKLSPRKDETYCIDYGMILPIMLDSTSASTFLGKFCTSFLIIKKNCPLNKFQKKLDSRLVVNNFSSDGDMNVGSLALSSSHLSTESKFSLIREVDSCNLGASPSIIV